MEHYVTLFDSAFLPQGLALHESLQRHAGRYTLWVLCIDESTYEVLQRLQLPNTRLLPLASVETPELLRVKTDRSRVEYCWTLTPFTPRFVFEQDPTAERVTYVDADLWFRANPEPLFREFESSGKEVLITDHSYAPEHDQSAKSGRYCVQFMTFTRRGGEVVRGWWEKRCLEWCFARQENGKFGDQKYLDDWPARFGEKVHVLQQTGLAGAPWNGIGFSYERTLFFHFHALRLLSNDRVSFGGYPLSSTQIRTIYLPYLDALARAVEVLRRNGFEPKPQHGGGLRLAVKRALVRTFIDRKRFVLIPLRA